MVDASRLDWDLGGHLVGCWDRDGDLRGCFLHDRFGYFESLSVYCYRFPMGVLFGEAFFPWIMRRCFLLFMIVGRSLLLFSHRER